MGPSRQLPHLCHVLDLVLHLLLVVLHVETQAGQLDLHEEYLLLRQFGLFFLVIVEFLVDSAQDLHLCLDVGDDVQDPLVGTDGVLLVVSLDELDLVLPEDGRPEHVFRLSRLLCLVLVEADVEGEQLELDIPTLVREADTYIGLEERVDLGAELVQRESGVLG